MGIFYGRKNALRLKLRLKTTALECSECHVMMCWVTSLYRLSSLGNSRLNRERYQTGQRIKDVSPDWTHDAALRKCGRLPVQTVRMKKKQTQKKQGTNHLLKTSMSDNRKILNITSQRRQTQLFSHSDSVWLGEEAQWSRNRL